MNPLSRLFGSSSGSPSVDDSSSSLDYLSGGSGADAFFRAMDGSSGAAGGSSGSDFGGDFGMGSGGGFGIGADFDMGGGGFDMNFGDIDTLFGGSSGSDAGTDAGVNSDGGFGGYFGSLMATLDGIFNGAGGSDGNISGDSGGDYGGGYGGGYGGDYGSDIVDISGDGGNNGASGNYQPMNMTSSPYTGSGDPGNVQSFNHRPYSKNAESMFGTYFDPKNATPTADGGMNIHMQGNAGSEITSPKDATSYGSYTTTVQTQDVHGANQTAFFYGDGRKFEVDLFEPGLHNGDVNTFTSGVWLDNVKVAEVDVKASDLGFKSFHDQPLTYKMDFTEGNIKISALNSKGEWQTIVNHSDPRINSQLARDTHFKEMFSAWGVNGQYNGAPVDFQVKKIGYSPQVI